jgi:hypothetical protein
MKKIRAGVIVDRLGVIQREAAALVEEDQRLRNKLKRLFSVGDLIEGTELFDAQVSSREKREARVDLLYRDLQKKDFLKIASVSLEKIGDVLPPEWAKKYVLIMGKSKTITIRLKGSFKNREEKPNGKHRRKSA